MLKDRERPRPSLRPEYPTSERRSFHGFSVVFLYLFFFFFNLSFSSIHIAKRMFLLIKMKDQEESKI